MNKVDKIIFRKINRISPSQFCSMRNCAYKSVLAEAFNKKPLLPISANAYFGTVLHKILELISKGTIKNAEHFDKSFNEQVYLQEANLQEQGYSFFVPLQKNVKDFGMKKVLLKKHLKIALEKPVTFSGVKFRSEEWFESKDKLIGGKIDLVVEEGLGVEIIDFKTGAIIQDVLDDDGAVFSEIREEYKEQLKLYACLYYETTGKFPTQLSLIDLAKQKFTISFSEVECITVFEEAKKLLTATNKSIGEEKFTANPTETNCKYCLYRPACSFFLKSLETDYSLRDVIGSVKNVVRYQNGNVSIFLENGLVKITVTNFPSEKFDELTNSKNKQISIFNLRKEAIDFVYSATKTTMIYEN